MFNNKNKMKNKNGANSISGQPAVNMISEGTTIKGTVTSQNDFRISGFVEGELEIKGKCIVTQTGKVKGDVQASDADISGTIDGKVQTANKLVLRQSAHVTGDIQTKVLLIEEGARFDGACSMGGKPEAKKEGEKSVPKPPRPVEKD